MGCDYVKEMIILLSNVSSKQRKNEKSLLTN